MTDLVAFLRACLDEDELVAKRAKEPGARGMGFVEADDNVTPLLFNADGEFDLPDRILAEVAAKRRLIAEAFAYEQQIDGEWGCCHSAAQIEAGECRRIPSDEIKALRILAAPYAGREGWRAEWATE